MRCDVTPLECVDYRSTCRVDTWIEGVEEGDLMNTLASLPPDSQDVIVAFDVIEHFTRSELLAFVDEVRRVLTLGGRWIIHTPNAESPFFGRVPLRRLHARGSLHRRLDKPSTPFLGLPESSLF